MPPKTRQTKEAAKLEIREKVREIQARQHSWLKQREEHISCDKDCTQRTVDKPKNTHSTTQQKILPKKRTSPENHNLKQNLLNSEASSENNNEFINKRPSSVPNAATRARFQKWLQVKSHTTLNEPRKTPEFNTTDKNNDVQAKAEHRFASKAAAYDSHKIRNELSPDMFDTLADSIVQRVKTELHFPQEQAGSPNNYHGDYYTNTPEDRYNETSDDAGYSETPDHEMESHYCPGCSILMLGPAILPMLIIPCGHTYCRKCLHRRRKCPTCSCEIGSSVCNVMLQQIISDFHKCKSTGLRDYDAKQYTNGISYEEEYQTLLTRYELLLSENKIQEENLQKLQGEIRTEKKQIKNIEKEEQRIKTKILSQQEKLGHLKEHREQYKRRVEEFEDRHFQEASSLALVQETLQSLKSEIEKMQLLSEHSRCNKMT